MTSQANLIVDDSDPQVQYSSGWEKLKGNSNESNEFNASTHATSTAGASFSLVFSGTGVTVFGTVGPNGPPNSTYSVDGAIPIVFYGPTLSGGPWYQQIFYQSPTLPNTEHTLVGSCAGSNSRPTVTLYVDYFVVTTLIPSSVMVTSVTNLSAGLVSASSSTRSTVKGGATIGGLVGGLVGGAAFVMILAGLLLFYRRNQMGGDQRSTSGTSTNVRQYPHADYMYYSGSTSSHSAAVPRSPEASQMPPAYTIEQGDILLPTQSIPLPRNKALSLSTRSGPFT